MHVELTTHTMNPEQAVADAAWICQQENWPDSIAEKTAANLIKKVVAMGHTSILEHASYQFRIQGISRACSHQLVRYRVGFSPSQQSQRYVKLNVDNDVFPWVIPDSIANDPGKKEDMLWLLTEIEAMYSQWVSDGIPEEDARFILPNAAKTKLSVTMNARALHHFFSQRCCTRSQWEIRNLAMAMWEECMKVSPTLFEICGPPCLHGKCPEGAMSCGKPWKG
jgi:thymidylate synthase (FAD)